MRLIDLFEAVKIDNVKGLGEVPDNQNVDYLGLRVLMRPSVFLRLVHSLPREQAQSADYIQKHLEQGGSIASPWLVISVPPEWETGDLEMPAKVVGHEGRNRMYAVMETEGDAPVETHLFFSGGVRHRHITPQWIKRLNNSLIPQGKSLPMGGSFFTTTGATNESTTRTTAKGAPGTLKAKITRHYGGDVTCAKAKKLKSRKASTPHDKAQANWFLNMQDCNESQLEEVFQTAPEPSKWMWNDSHTIVSTSFKYEDHRVEIILKLYDAPPEGHIKHVARHHGIDLPDHYTGFNIGFRVDKQVKLTGAFGVSSVQLLGKIVALLRGYLSVRKWDYLVFTGEQGSRNRLYLSMARRLAQEVGGDVLHDKDLFVVVKPQAARDLNEVFQGSAPETRWWSQPRSGAARHITSFEVDDHLVRISLTQDVAQRDLHDALEQSQMQANPKSVGYTLLFDVDGDIDKTGLLGKRSVSLMAGVVKRVADWMRTNKWDYVTFIGERGSRNKLYQGISRFLARETGSKTYFDFDTSDFVIYKPTAVLHEEGGVGRIVKGVNTTADVQPGETQRQAQKFLNKVSPEGVPPQLSPSGRFAPPK